MKAKVIGVVIIGIVLIGGVFLSIRTGPLWIGEKNGAVDPKDVSSADTTIDVPGVSYGYVTASSTIPKDTKQGLVGAPSLTRPVVIPKDFSPETAISARKENALLTEALTKNPGNAALWADLGMNRKGIEDYVGAKEAYAYALILQPKNAVVADNLGVIYGDYLKDYPKAEQHFRLAISLEPKTEYRYLRLFEFYQYALKDMRKAKAILEEGLRAIPGDTSFTALLETL